MSADAHPRHIDIPQDNSSDADYDITKIIAGIKTSLERLVDH